MSWNLETENRLASPGLYHHITVARYRSSADIQLLRMINQLAQQVGIADSRPTTSSSSLRPQLIGLVLDAIVVGMDTPLSGSVNKKCKPQILLITAANPSCNFEHYEQIVQRAQYSKVQLHV